VRNINKVIKAIAARIGIQTPISTYTARHTFASRLAHLGAPLTLISESLHHANTKTTQIYLGKFPSKEKKEWFKKL
jgi:site-specific recombinase XerD